MRDISNHAGWPSWQSDSFITRIARIRALPGMDRYIPGLRFMKWPRWRVMLDSLVIIPLT